MAFAVGYVVQNVIGTHRPEASDNHPKVPTDKDRLTDTLITFWNKVFDGRIIYSKFSETRSVLSLRVNTKPKREQGSEIPDIHVDSQRNATQLSQNREEERRFVPKDPERYGVV